VAKTTGYTRPLVPSVLADLMRFVTSLKVKEAKLAAGKRPISVKVELG
jgi:hypothetical protein